MNVHTPADTPKPSEAARGARPPPPKARPRQPIMSREDREFLPAALELVETPPSPIRIMMIWLICLLVVAALVWSWFGKLDIHAIAQGRIQPSGRSKEVQPLEAGKVRAVFVQNGDEVREGDPLVELDSTETAADKDTLLRELDATRAEILRLKAAIEAARSAAVSEPMLDFPANTDATIQRRERAVLAADLAQLASARESLKAQLAEKAALGERLRISIRAREKLLAVLKQRVDIRQSLVDRKAGTLSAVIDGVELYERAATDNAVDHGQLLEAEASGQSIRRRLDELTTQFIADKTQKSADAEKRRDRAEQELIKANSKNERTRLASPISGTVQQLAVTTLGQVVAGGQSLLTIVPSQSQVEIEANVTNLDIGFVQVGQEAVVKVEAFPFTRYGTAAGRVTKISRDSIDEQDANAQAGVSVAPRSQAAARGQVLVFPATIELRNASLNVEGRDVPLSAGMAVTVEIKTGERRVIDFLLSPLKQYASQAARER